MPVIQKEDEREEPNQQLCIRELSVIPAATARLGSAEFASSGDENPVFLTSRGELRTLSYYPVSFQSDDLLGRVAE